MEDIVETVETSQSVPSPAPASAVRKVMVVFNYVRADGSSGLNRVFIDGVADLRTVNDITQVEAMLMEQYQLVSVMISNWRSLEG